MNSAKICWLTCGKAVSNPVINSDINKEISVLSPFGGGRCFVAIKKNSERMREIASNGKITLALEAYYNVVGMLPPVNNIGKHETSKFPDYFGGIQRSHLVYKGLNRPCVKRGMDLELYVYISKQEYKYKYVPDMVCPAKQVAVNDGFLFAVIVSFSDGQNKTGEVLNWEWVESSPDDPSKPIDFESRYEKEVRQNEYA
ncbi:MAG: hypothetical protein U5M23_03105 [Marinagarivorans sp.]|nr:hypothetical protein [Marinagarivorans sp.]